MPGYLMVTFRDDFGRESTRRYEMTDQVLLADYVANANLFFNLLDPVTDLHIVKAAMRLTDGLLFDKAGTAGCNIDVGATFVGELGDSVGKKGILRLPGIPISLVDAQGQVDLEQADVAAWLDLFGDPLDNKFKISDGEYVETWLKGTLDR
jgi:hypothetical protein